MVITKVSKYHSYSTFMVNNVIKGPGIDFYCLTLNVKSLWYFETSVTTGLSKKMDGIWNRYNLKSTGRIYTFGVSKCSEKFKVLDLP